MKPRFQTRQFANLLFVSLALAMPSAHAGTLYWDPDGDATGNTLSPVANLGGTGTWDAANTNWWDGTAVSDQVWSSTETAVFTGAAPFTGDTGRVQLGANTTAAAMQFDTTGYIIDLCSAKAGTTAYDLTINGISGSAGAIVNSSTQNATRALTLNLAADTTWNGTISVGGNGRMNFTYNSLKTFNLGGQINVNSSFGQQTLTVTGGGRMNLVGNTGSTGNGGNLTVSGNSTFDLGSNQYAVRGLTFTAGSTITSPGTGRLILNSQFTPTATVAGILGGSVGLEATASLPANAVISVSNNANNYTGGTFFTGSLNSGVTIRASANNALGTGPVSIATTNASNTARLEFTSATPSIGSLASSGAGQKLLVLGTTGVDTVLTVGPLNADTTFGGVISNFTGQVGSITKTGTGLWSLGGQSTYSGGTIINGGSVIATAANTDTSSSPVGIGAVTANNGGTFAYLSGSATPSTLTLVPSSGTALSLADGSAMGTQVLDTVAVATGAVASTAGTVTWNVHGVAGQTVPAGTKTIATAPSGLGGATTNNLALYNNTNFTASNLQATGTAVTVDTVDATPLTAAYWNGSLTGGVWSQSNGSTNSNWQAASGAVVNQPLIPTGVLLTFDGIGTLPATTSLGTNMSAAGVDVTANNTSALNIVSPIHALTLGTTGLSVANGAGAVSIGTNIVLNGNQTWAINSANSVIVTGAISGGSTTLTKTGTGTLILAATSIYNGTTSVNGGVLRLNVGSALPGGIGATGGTSNLTLNGGVLGLTAASGDFNRSILNTAAGVQWAGGGTGGFAAYGGNRIVNFGGAAAGVTWNTAGTSVFGAGLILSAADSDSTVTLVNPVSLNNATRTVTVNNGSAAVDGVVSGIVSHAAGKLTKAGDGTLALTAANTYGTNFTAGTVFTTISAGTLQIGNGGATGSISTTGDIDNSGTLAINRSDALTLSNVIIGSGSVNQVGTGVTTLNAANTYSGTTTVFAGTLLVNGAQTSATGGITVKSTGLLGGNGSSGGAVTMESGGGLAASITDWTGSAGTGYDDLDVVSLNAASVPIHLRITTTALANFTEAAASFTIVNTTGGITNFSPSNVTITAPGFTGTGTWSVAVVTNSLVLSYSPSSGTNTFTGWAGLNGVTGGVNGDSDKDGIPNGVEYGLNTNPAGSDGSPGTYTGTLLSFDKRMLTSGNTDLSYRIEISPDLGITPWVEVGSYVTNTTSVLSANIPTGPGETTYFARLRVVVTP